MSEPATFALSVSLPPSSLAAWRESALPAPEQWTDWDILDARPADFALWRRVGQGRISATLNDLLASGQDNGTVFESTAEGRLAIVVLLASGNWREQLMILGIVRTLEMFGARDGWAIMHDYVFDRAGTAWAVTFPLFGRSQVFAAPPAALKDAADALVLPVLNAARARRD